MYQEYIQCYSHLTDRSHSKAVLRNKYKVLTGDCSSSRSASEKQIDERITKLAEEAFELNEPNILLDLRRMNGKLNATMFEQFWVELS